MGSLRTFFGAIGALEEVGVLGETDVLEAEEQEPPDTGTKANEGARAQAEGRADDTGVTA